MGLSDFFKSAMDSGSSIPSHAVLEEGREGILEGANDKGESCFYKMDPTFRKQQKHIGLSAKYIVFSPISIPMKQLLISRSFSMQCSGA